MTKKQEEEILRRALEVGLDKITFTGVKPIAFTGDEDEKPTKEELAHNHLAALQSGWFNYFKSWALKHKDTVDRFKDGYTDIELDYRVAKTVGIGYDGMISVLKWIEGKRGDQGHTHPTEEITIDMEQEFKDKSNIDFWVKYGLKPMNRKMLNDFYKKLEHLQSEEVGIDIEEYLNTAYCHDMSELGYEHRRMLETLLETIESPEAEEEFLKNPYTEKDYERVMGLLDTIEAKHKKKPNSYLNMSAEGIGYLMEEYGYDLLENSIMVAEVEEKKIAGIDKTYKVYKFNGQIKEDELDRDKLKGFDMGLIKRAQEIYDANKNFFENAFQLFYQRNHGTGVGLIGLQETFKKYEDPKYLEPLNEFRHALYQIRKQSDKSIKLGNDAKPVYAPELNPESDFSSAEVVVSEIGVIDTCYKMLKDASKKVTVNSSEYKTLMKKVGKLKDILNDPDKSPNAKKQAYSEGVEKALDALTAYYVHKAKDNIKDDGTKYKLMAVNRVQNLLNSRYKALNNAVYEDKLDVGGLFDAKEAFDVDNKISKEIVGDRYALASATEKIKAIKEAIKETAKEINKDKKIDKKAARTNSAGDIKVDNDEKVEAEVKRTKSIG